MRKFAVAFVGLAPIALAGALMSPVEAAGGWQPPQNLRVGDLSGVSCPSVNFCAVIGQDGRVSLFHASGWSSPVQVTSGISDVFPSVSCASATFCVASGDGSVSIYDGAGWSATAMVDQGSHIESLSCPTDTFCAAVDTAYDALIYKSGVWSRRTTTGLTSHASDNHWGDFLSCTSSKFCMFVAGMWSAQFDGTSWDGQQLVEHDKAMQSVSCATATFCIGTDQYSRWMRFDGTAWTHPQPIERRVPSIGNISCPSTTFCAEVNYSAHSRFFNGNTWSDTTTVSRGLRRPPRLNLVSCSSDSFCLDANAHGQVAFYQG